MIEIFIAEEFEKHYQKLPLSIQKKAEKKEQIFRQNPFYPSLRTEKLEPRHKETWSFRIDREYRILFRYLGPNKVIFLICGHHNWIYKYRF